MFVVFSVGTAVAQTHTPAHAPMQPQADISPQKMQALLDASAELDRFFESHYRKLERARPNEIPALQEALTTEPKAILERHNLTREDLTAWRQRLEAHGDIPTEDMEDPHYNHVVKRLMPRQP